MKHQYTGLNLTQDNYKPYLYRIELWIGGIKSKNERTFDDHHKALSEVVRIMDGLRLPLESLSINIIGVSAMRHEGDIKR